MNLTNFRNLSSEIKALATRYWLAVILDNLDLENPNQLSKLIKNKTGIGKYHGCSVSFLYKKNRGSPIDSEVKIKLMEDLLPGSSRCLTNPLWQLLDSPLVYSKDTTSILHSLNAYVTSSLFDPSTDMTYPKRRPHLNKKQILNIAKFNTPDALTCLLVLSLEHHFHKRLIERLAYQLFIRLTTFTPLSTIQFELHQLLYYLFFPKTEKQIRQMEIYELTTRFSIDMPDMIRIKSAFFPENDAYLKLISAFYTQTTEDMVSLNLIQDTPHAKMLFCQLFDNTDITWIKIGIAALKNGIKHDHSAQLLPQLLRQMKSFSYNH